MARHWAKRWARLVEAIDFEKVETVGKTLKD